MLRDVHAPIEHEKDDILGRYALAKRIYDRLHSEDSPQVIGVYGGWGTGKTSLLKLLLALNQGPSVEESKTIYVELLDAWQYEAAGNLLVPVIVQLKKLSGDERFLPGSWQASIRRVLTVTTLSLAGLALGKSPIQLKDIRAIWEDIEKRDKEDSSSILFGWETLTDAIRETENAFQEVVSAVLKEQKCDRLVLCIDNLDRCSPDRAVNLLESVKNFFSAPGCVWLFAMDSDVIASYIRHKYEGTAMDGYAFLDKIIPEQYHLSFFPEENDPRIYDLIRSVTSRDLTLNDWKRLPLIPNVMVPRRLKKSAVKFAECFSGPNPADADRDTVFLLSLLYHTWPNFYGRLSSALLDHVAGVLANFFNDRNTSETRGHWGAYSPLPLDKEFVDDQDLIQFFRTAFPDARRSPRDVAVSVQRALSALRRVGLP
ncbi:MAG: KAP family NTPase [Anaerolineae bacterium]|nr:KAP family NTPase [Anaerolineae bacterium]MCI0608951.1 KAP family NTPase [Anaerolineae bacterium]